MKDNIIIAILLTITYLCGVFMGYTSRKSEPQPCTLPPITAEEQRTINALREWVDLGQDIGSLVRQHELDTFKYHEHIPNERAEKFAKAVVARYEEALR
jgi:hypothetical protein